MTLSEKDQKIEHRRVIASWLENVAANLDELERYWTMQIEDPDTLRPEEWPFDVALEDLTANVGAAVRRIRNTNELMALEPVHMTVPREEYEWLLNELKKPPKELPELKAMLERHRPDDAECWEE